MSDIHETIAFLKGAVGRGKMAGLFGCYSVHRGVIYARDTRMMAGAVWDAGDDSFNAPADEIEAALDRMDGTPTIRYADGILKVNLSRLRASIECVPGEPPAHPDFDNLPWQAVPGGFAETIKIASKFTGTDPSSWTSGLRLMDNRVTAINNRCGIDIILEELDMSPACLITTECAAFISANVEGLIEYASADGALWLRWESGNWLKAQLIVGQFPAQVEAILDSAGVTAPIAITPEWSAAYKDAAALADTSVTIRREGIYCGKGAGRAEIEAEIDLPEDQTTNWSTELLDMIVPLATHWNPGAAPEKALFVGHNLRGVVMPIKGARG